MVLLLPCEKPGVGSGYALSIAIPLGLSLFVGMMLPAKGCPVCGSMMICGVLKNALGAVSSSLKSPRRMASLGDVSVLVTVAR